MSLALFTLIGFTCTAVDPQLGVSCRGHLDKKIYSEEIALFVPASLASLTAAKLATRPELIVHFHGHHAYRDHLKRIDTFEDLLDEFRFDEMLAASGRQSILVVPSSQGACDTFKAELSTLPRFNGFVTALGKLFSKAGLSKGVQPSRLVLTGHSGAHQPISSLLASGLDAKVSEVLLFDALYVMRLQHEALTFAKFAAQAPKKRFAVAFVDGGTSAGSRLVWSLLPKRLRGASFESDVLSPHVTPSELNRLTPLFVRSDQEHWRTVNKYFPLFLQK